MYLLSYLRELFVDFLFPKSAKILELEALSTDYLLDVLPPAENLKDKYTWALFNYNQPLVKEVVWEIKYKGNPQIARKIGVILFDHIRQELLDLAIFEKWDKSTSSDRRPILLPMPISDKRRFERGWNQAELLVKEIMVHDRDKIFKYLPKQLVKYRHTESQTTTASRNERLKNIVDSMKILNPSSVAGACVIILDDVTTTGATFAEARRALRAAGARKILCIAVAH